MEETPRTQLKNFVENLEEDYIITNGKLAIAIEDLFGFAREALNGHGIGEIYPIGRYKNVRVFVDPTMTWNDSRILSRGRELLINIEDPEGTLV